MLDYEDDFSAPLLAAILHRTDNNTVAFSFRTTEMFGDRTDLGCKVDVYTMHAYVGKKAVQLSSDSLTDLMDQFFNMVLQIRKMPTG